MPSSTDRDLERRVRDSWFERRNLVATSQPTGASPSGGSGDGTSGGLEERVKKLEADIADVKTGVAVIQETLRSVATKGDLGDVASDLGTLNERSRHMLTAADLAAAKDAIAAGVRGQLTLVGVGLALLTIALKIIG